MKVNIGNYPNPDGILFKMGMNTEQSVFVKIDEWDTFDAKVYRVNIDEFPKIQADNNVVILPTIIFFDDGEEVERLQGDMSFTLKTTTDELDEVVEEILGNKF